MASITKTQVSAIVVGGFSALPGSLGFADDTCRFFASQKSCDTVMGAIIDGISLQGIIIMMAVAVFVLSERSQNRDNQERAAQNVLSPIEGRVAALETAHFAMKQREDEREKIFATKSELHNLGELEPRVLRIERWQSGGFEVYLQTVMASYSPDVEPQIREHTHTIRMETDLKFNSLTERVRKLEDGNG